MLHIVIVQIGTSSSYNYLIFSITRLIVGNYVSRCQCPIFLYQNSSTTPKTWSRIVVADRTTPIHKQLKFTFPWQRVSAMKYSRWCTIIEYSCGWENKNWKQKYLFFLFVTYAKLLRAILQLQLLTRTLIRTFFLYETLSTIHGFAKWRIFPVSMINFQTIIVRRYQISNFICF